MSKRTPLPAGLIVNADDLAIHPSINAGIFSAYRLGILTSATMLMTTEYLEETTQQVRTETLPVGIHLSLTLGKSAAKPGDVPDLVDENGKLNWSARQFLLCNFSGQNQKLISQIHHEFRAQIERALDYGLRPTHADSHQHVHMNPAIYSILQALLPSYGISRVRWSRERLLPGGIRLFFKSGKLINLPKVALLRYLSRETHTELTTTDEFFGILFSGIITKEVFLQILENISPQECSEICIHPGFPIGENDKPYPIASVNSFIRSDGRQVEHDILTDPTIIDILRKRGLILRDFSGAEKQMSYS